MCLQQIKPFAQNAAALVSRAAAPCGQCSMGCGYGRVGVCCAHFCDPSDGLLRGRVGYGEMRASARLAQAGSLQELWLCERGEGIF